jgi:hypothetical protein
VRVLWQEEQQKWPLCNPIFDESAKKTAESAVDTAATWRSAGTIASLQRWTAGMLGRSDGPPFMDFEVLRRRQKAPKYKYAKKTCSLQRAGEGKKRGEKIQNTQK